MEFINLVPNMFSAEDNALLGHSIMRVEISEIIKECAKEKSSGPDGWEIELFMHFKELMMPSLLIQDQWVYFGCC